jgi:hypothetical protein
MIRRLEVHDRRHHFVADPQLCLQQNRAEQVLTVAEQFSSLAA